jgi:Zn-dependent protease with chaperone function
MVSFEDFLTQFLQPYFFYSLVFLSISFVCTKVFLKFNPFMSRRTQSIIYLIPLFVPVFVLIFFSPQTLISTSKLYLFQLQQASGIMVSGAIIQTVNIFSITGLLCLGGAIAASVYLIVTLVSGQRIAMKAFHVIIMSPDEYGPLQEKVKEISKRLGISAPKVGLTEDLRPNAFTLGYGRHTMIVFSLGILNMLNTDELTAVASHELAHVKSADYLFRSLSYTLNILSFFNPLSYFAVSEAQKERELLADERGAALLSKPNLMADVLAKLEKVLQVFPKERFTDRLSTNLFLVSPIARKSEILAAHPNIAHRVHNINAVTSKPAPKPRYKAATLLLLSILIFTALLAGYSTMQFQTSFLKKDYQKNEVFNSNTSVTDAQSAMYNVSLENGSHLLVEMLHGLPSVTAPMFLQVNGDIPIGSQPPTMMGGSGIIQFTNETGTTQFTLENPQVAELPAK